MLQHEPGKSQNNFVKWHLRASAGISIGFTRAMLTYAADNQVNLTVWTEFLPSRAQNKCGWRAYHMYQQCLNITQANAGMASHVISIRIPPLFLSLSAYVCFRLRDNRITRYTNENTNIKFTMQITVQLNYEHGFRCFLSDIPFHLSPNVGNCFWFSIQIFT